MTVDYNWLVAQCHVPVFFETWYLNAVCGANGFDSAISYIDPQIWGILPYFTANYQSYTVAIAPPLTQYMGPFLHIDSSISRGKQISLEEKLISNLLDQLSQRCDYYAQKWGPWQQNWLGAYYNHCKEASRITYIIDGQSSYETVKNGYSTQVRNKTKNKDNITVVTYNDVELLYSMVLESLDRVGKKPKFAIEELHRLTSAAIANHAGEILVAFLPTGVPIASAFIIEDSKTLYYYIAGEYAAYRGANGPTLIIDKCIQKACAQRKRLDFTGSMLPGVGRFYQSFGPTLINYHMISKDNRSSNHLANDSLDRVLFFRF